MLKRTLTLCAWLSLTACAYHLRGSVEVPETMKHVHVKSASPQLLAGFKDTLKMVGGQLVDAPESGGVVVNVLNERSDRRTLSLSATGKASEFELHYIVEFELLTHDAKVVIPKQLVEVNRDYYNDQQDIMGKSNEEAQIRLEMYQQAVRSIIDRCRALTERKK